MIGVLVVHGDQAVQQQLTAVLQGETDLSLAGVCSDVAQAQALLEQTPCEVVLASATLGFAAVLSLMRSLYERQPATKVIILDLPAEPETILAYLEEGAAGYLCQHESWAELVKRIYAVHEEEGLLDPEVAGALIQRIAQLKQLIRELDGESLAVPQEMYGQLSPRELQVLRMIGEDMSNQAIADALMIEVGTVKNHVHALLNKLGVYSRKQAARLAPLILGRKQDAGSMAKPVNQ